MVFDATGPVLAQLQGPPLPENLPGVAAAEVVPDGDTDVRVLPIRWRGEKRQRNFAEAVELMEHHDFGDSELEGEPTCLWFMEKIAQTGLTPVARHGLGLPRAGSRRWTARPTSTSC